MTDTSGARMRDDSGGVDERRGEKKFSFTCHPRDYYKVVLFPAYTPMSGSLLVLILLIYEVKRGHNSLLLL